MGSETRILDYEFYDGLSYIADSVNIKLCTSDYTRKVLWNGLSLTAVQNNHNQQYVENKEKIYENFKKINTQDFSKSYKFCETIYLSFYVRHKCHRWPYFNTEQVSVFWPFCCSDCEFKMPSDIRKIIRKQYCENP